MSHHGPFSEEYYRSFQMGTCALYLRPIVLSPVSRLLCNYETDLRPLRLEEIDNLVILEFIEKYGGDVDATTNSCLGAVGVARGY